MPQRSSPAAAAASSVRTAWWARWNAPSPRWTIPTRVVRGSTAGPTTSSSGSPRAARAGMLRRGRSGTLGSMGVGSRGRRLGSVGSARARGDGAARGAARGADREGDGQDVARRGERGVPLGAHGGVRVEQEVDRGPAEAVERDRDGRERGGDEARGGHVVVAHDRDLLGYRGAARTQPVEQAEGHEVV